MALHQPQFTRKRLNNRDEQKFHGFSPLFAELSTGADLDDPAARAAQECFSEAFDIGYEIDGDLQQPPGASLPPDPYELYGDNQWPSDEILPGFRETFLRYYAQLLELSRDLMRIFALALDLPENFFDDKMKFPGAMARMMHYPPQPAGEKMAGLAAHTVGAVLSQRPSHTCLWKLLSSGLRMRYNSVSRRCSGAAGAQQSRTMDPCTANSRDISSKYCRLSGSLVSHYHCLVNFHFIR